MSKLHIFFCNYAPDSGEAVVPLEVINERLEHVEYAPRILTLSQSVEVDVEPGTYLVRTYLPSGELVSKQTTVDAGKTSDVALTAAQRSPDEEVGWSSHLKRAPQRPHQRGFFPSIPIAKPSLCLWRANGLDQWTQLPASSFHEDSRRDDFPSLRQIRVTTESSSLWLCISWATRNAKFLALPPAKEVLINVLTGDMLTEDADPIGVAIDSHNPKAEALLGYLHCGDFGSARAVGRVVTNDAEERLREKRLDPNTAVICGYFSLLASSDEQMHDWLRNLEHWFDFLPDGAVVHAWQALTESTPNFAIARERLLVAAQRGLPTYAFGVRLLYDGLALITQRALEKRNVRDEEAAYWANRIAQYAMCLDWRSVTTTFYGVDPKQPRRLQEG